MKILKLSLASLIIAGSLSAYSGHTQDADDGIETLSDQEQTLPAMPRISGPITIIRPAALVFTTFDTDRDYHVTRAEALLGARDAFDRADKDGNGRVSLFELEDWRVAALGSLDALPGNLNFDTDYNNQVFAEEFETALLDLFDRHDEDADATLKHAELMTILEVPRRKAPEKERQTDQECLDQIQRSRKRF
ncbi:MAG: hypothetical protein HKN36_03090 [Hellea sp.]|nr:hypothetical protein [Hellea sp.]